MDLLKRIASGRTDLIFAHLAAGSPATTADADGVKLIQRCAYYGDVSAVRYLLTHGESLRSLGDDLGLHAACFHGHWQLCEFLIESGADVNLPLANTGETPLHAALCKQGQPRYNLVVRVLLAHGADPNRTTLPGVETGAFMRDCRTQGETALHRAAAFADEEVIQLLLDAGAVVDAKDMAGDSPLAWASWHLRPAAILSQLCYGEHRIPAGSQPMETNLRGKPIP